MTNDYAGIHFDGQSNAKNITTNADRANGLTRIKVRGATLLFQGTQARTPEGFTTGSVNCIINEECPIGHPDRYMFMASGINIPMSIKLDENVGSGVCVNESKGKIKIDTKNDCANYVGIFNSPNTQVVNKDENDEVKQRTIGYY